MMTWRDHHEKNAAELEQQRQAAAREKSDRATVRGTPMKERVRRLIRGIPDGQRHWPRHISYFVDQLEPRWAGDKAAARDVAYALRQNGWIRKRNWKGGEVGYTTYWHPPESA